MRVLLIGAVALALSGGAAMADSWKDERTVRYLGVDVQDALG